MIELYIFYLYLSMAYHITGLVNMQLEEKTGGETYFPWIKFIRGILIIITHNYLLQLKNK